MIKTKKQSFIVIGVFALVLMLGTVTYAFFNYTITGVANNIRTGRISFNTSQSDTLNLTNVFPMSATDAGNANLDAVSLRIWGDTTYAGGEEYEITIVGVNNTVNNKTIPINYIASYSATPVEQGEDPNVIGTSSNDYFADRGSTTAVYSLTSTGEATNGAQVLVGYIPKDVAVDGTLTIKAYLDVANVVISDTYYENAPMPRPTASPLASPNDEYGTPASFGEGKTVLTTAEWNSLQDTQDPISFRIKAESNEGTWVEEPVVSISTIASCPGCKFMAPIGLSEGTIYNYGGNSNANATETSSITDIITNDYTTLNKNYFLGFTETQDGKIDRLFACGIKGTDNNGNVNQGTPFCVEGATDTSLFETNKNLITGETLWNDSDFTAGRCDNNGYDGVYCGGSVPVWLDYSYGDVEIDADTGGCYIRYSGYGYCSYYG